MQRIRLKIRMVGCFCFFWRAMTRIGLNRAHCPMLRLQRSDTGIGGHSLAGKGCYHQNGEQEFQSITHLIPMAEYVYCIPP